MVGEDGADYSKSQSLQMWMFNCNLFDTLMVLTKNGIYFLGSEKKAQFFSPLDTKENLDPAVPPFTIMNRDKACFEILLFMRLIHNCLGIKGQVQF
jgi:nucleosome binding factor SPN SPT16 subunit